VTSSARRGDRRPAPASGPSTPSDGAGWIRERTSARAADALPVQRLATIRELLGVAPLRLAIAAGEEGIDRPIRWAHAIELQDPRPYLRGGELVLTMGWVLRDEGACQTFVEAVLEREASGIGFGIGNYHAAVPPVLVDACALAGLPLLVVPVEIPFIAITEWLAERMAEQRAERDRRALRREIGLLDALAEGRGLEGVAGMIARELGGTIVITDPGGFAEAVAGQQRDPRGLDLVAGTVAGVRPGERRASGTGEGTAWDLVAVRQHDRALGWLAWLRAPGSGRPDGIEILHEVAPIVSIELATRAAERDSERRAVGRLLDVVRSGIADPVVLAERVAEAGLNDGRLVASVWPADGAETLRRAIARAFAGETGGRLVIVADDPEALSAIAAQHRFPCGIGSQVGLRELGRSIVEAEAAFDTARAAGGVSTWRELAALPALLGQQPPDRLAAFATQLVLPLVEYDARHATDLVATLRAFVDEEGGVEASARRLHVHQNTLRHRLRRIRSLVGRDPVRFLDRVALYVGLWAWDARDRRTPQRAASNVVGSDD